MGVEGRTILFTGTLMQLKRADAAKKASKAGASVAASFNKSVDLVIAGQDSGSKLDKARDQGVEIWDEEAFIAAVDGSGAASGSAPAPAPAPAKKSAKKEAAPPPPAADPAATSFSVPSRGKFSSPGRKIDRALKNGAIPYNKKSTSINGKSITFTGKISLKRADATAMAEKEGAHVQSSITKSTQIVVAASDAGNKLDKAKDLGLEIWSENDFREACGLAREDEDDDDEEDDEDEEEEESGGDGKKQKSAGAVTKKLEIPSNLLKEISDSVDAKNVVFLGAVAGSAQLDTLKTSAESSGANVQETANNATDILVLLDFSPDVVTKARELGVGDVEVWSLEHFETVCQAVKAKRDQEAQKRAEEGKIERGEDDDEEDEEDEDGDGEDTNDADLTLDGRNLLFTGTLKLMKRADATKRAILAGATVASSLTKAVDLVVSGGDDAGAKLDKARDQGIEIWTEQQFASALEKLGEAEEGSSSDPVKGKAVKSAPGSKRKRGAAAVDEDDDNEAAPKADTVQTAKDDSGDASVLEGKNICFTGTLLQLKRADASKQAVAAGAKVLSSITKACNLVVAGADAGSKLDKARDSGVEIWSEEKFLEIVQGGGSSGASPGKKARA
ncbi:hypothetical protein BJ741DRAFT_703651 [Chytriomyces cf. hyalinus JEL632]|nr:hypothetical protein BJ741DRAFT_703651 [Chytriomyces cf. hyalinus JEL632]